jgi:hypothetical protein
MNSLVHDFSPQRVPGTILLAFGAAMATGPACWPSREVARYSPQVAVESYSEVRRAFVQVDHVNQDQAKFEQQISEIYSTMVSQQIPLDHEIASVWEAHVEELYES